VAGEERCGLQCGLSSLQLGVESLYAMKEQFASRTSRSRSVSSCSTESVSLEPFLQMVTLVSLSVSDIPRRSPDWFRMFPDASEVKVLYVGVDHVKFEKSPSRR